VSVARTTEKAPPVDDVPLSRDAVALLYIGDETSNLDDVAGELVSHHEWRLAPALCPGIPVIDVDVGATDAGAAYSYEDFVLADPRLLDILQLETGCRGFLYERFHERVIL